MAGEGQCAGCEARDREIDYLRSRIEKLEERALEILAPGVTRRESASQVQADDAIPVSSIKTGPDGQQYLEIDGRPVQLSTFLLAKREGGGIDEQGRYIPPDEYRRAMAKVQEMVAGG